MLLHLTQPDWPLHILACPCCFSLHPPQFYCEDALAVPNYPLSPLPTYYIPDNGPLQSFKDYIATLPATDRPEAFGQHPNAEISYLIEDSKVGLGVAQPTGTIFVPKPTKQSSGCADWAHSTCLFILPFP